MVWWKLDETTGTTAADSSDNILNGTLTNGPVWTTGGHLNNCLSFDGTDDYVNLNNPSQLQLTGAMTLTAWVYIDTFTTNGKIITKCATSGARGWELGLESGGYASFILAVNSTTQMRIDSSAIPSGQWVQLAGVYEPGTALRIYVNRTLNTSNTAAQIAALRNKF